MKILVVTKRQYTNKDLLDDQYGRLWEIPLQLAQSGHHIKGFCLSYRYKAKVLNPNVDSSVRQVEWKTYNIFPGFLRYVVNLHRMIRQFKPDVIWFSSDCFHIILGCLLGKIYQIPSILDLYDNYEFFKLSSFPGVIPAYRLAVKKADAISCVSLPLKRKLVQSCQPVGEIKVIENAIDTHLFFPHAQKSCREYFGLPDDIKLIGTAGALHGDRGINNLYEAFNRLAEQDNRLHLVVAGEGSRNHPVFQHANVHDLGVLEYDKIPLFFGILDVAVIFNANNAFGNYCYPQKANEILACNTPLLAADVGVMSELLKSYPECLYKPGNVIDLAEKIKNQIYSPTDIKIPANTWQVQAGKLEKLINSLVKN